jgi:peptidyl-prolyl cis-trans isomerase B (cyclophilin B)
MIQGGDPNSKDLAKAQWWGTGGNEADGKEVNVKAEFNDIKHDPGVLSMARSSDPDSASSQFFIMHKKSPHLDGQYSAFGRVVSGMEVVDKIATMPAGRNGQVEPSKAVVLKSVKIEKWPLKG